MKIKRVSEVKSVFEISDIEFYDIMDIDNFNLDDFELDGGHENDMYRKYRLLHDGDAPQIKLLDNIFRELEISLKEILTPDDIGDWYSFDYVKKYDFSISGYSINLDSPYFNMGPHVDGEHGLSTLIINLKDNPGAHTIYYNPNQDLGDLKEIYRGPSKKGTGVIHINRPDLLHSGINESENERYHLMKYYPFK